jgi:hypothetical protein
MSGELLRQVVESEGKAIQAAAKAGRLPVTWDHSDCPALDKDHQQTDKTRVYLGCDGVMVPTITEAEKHNRRQKTKAKRKRCGKKRQALPRRAKKGADLPYKEFKIVTLYDDTCEHRLVSVTRGDCEKAGELMRQDAGRVGLDKADDKVALVDGAEWIKNQLKQQSVPLDAIGLDFYHFAQNVHKARRAVYGEEDPKDKTAPGNAWAGGVLHLAKHGSSYVELEEAVWDWAMNWRGVKRKAALGLLNYMSEREDMIRYKEFQEVGRQIGSGPTESMCKATTQRIKGRGMRWDADNAEALMAIEALEQSGGWQAYWDSLLAQAA